MDYQTNENKNKNKTLKKKKNETKQNKKNMFGCTGSNSEGKPFCLQNIS